MLTRFIFKPSHLRFLPLLSSKTHFPQSNPHFFPKSPHFYSTNNGNNNNNPPDIWNFSSNPDPTVDSLFPKESSLPNLGANEIKAEKAEKMDSWLGGGDEEEKGEDIFKREGKREGGGGWDVDDDVIKSWDLSVGVVEEGKVEEEMFKGVELKGNDDGAEVVDLVLENDEENKKLEEEEKGLTAVLKGPDRAFGDLIAASGITDEMLDSLIALKDLAGIQGLPPLTEIEDMRYENNTKRSSRADIERQKQEEVARARVREVDSKGRAYGTGKRKCSIARVWIQPGEGKFVVNDKEFDVYFPMLDHRAALLKPFTETKTLGIWDVNCTVKGGGVSGQVGAVRLGISRALQCWDPTLRPPLKEAGFLTRDSRVVERKKPGRAKARKSFQWVKR